MFDISHLIPPEQVSTVKWNGNGIQYDVGLYQLGNGKREFWVLNPDCPSCPELFNLFTQIPKTKKCVVFAYNNDWLVKLFRNGWHPMYGYEIVEVDLNLTWTKNPDIDNEILFEEDPKIKNDIKLHDLAYELIWTIDPLYFPNDEPVWLYKVKSNKLTSKGTKFMGDLSPKLEVVVNPIFSDLDFRIDYTIPWYDLKYEHMWMLDPKHTVTAKEPVWALKVKATAIPAGTKVMGNIEPYGELAVNEQVTIPFKLPKDFAVQHYDFLFEHVWISKERNEKIWLAKLTYVDNPKGIKEIDITDQLNPDSLDVVFISYGELNAETNWIRVKEKAPWAKRVDGVKGILEAHQAAARLAKTEMFYVVDGDALLLKKWEFKYKPSIFDRDCTYIWSAKNPMAQELTYGHGGVKLFAKDKLLKLKKWRTLDMTTSISDKIKVMSEISNWTAFNTDEFSVWKTAFRECVKLAVNVHRYPENPEHQLRLDKWLAIDQTQPFGQIAFESAQQAMEFVDRNSFDMTTLIKINDREWLEDLYTTTYTKEYNE